MPAGQDSQLKVSRSFQAPLDVLWKAWTVPRYFKTWYGPTGFSVPTCEIELKVGGSHLWSMLSQDGTEMFYAGEYKEIVPMKRLVYTDALADANGNWLDPSAAGMPKGTPINMEVTVTFSHEEGETTVTVSHIASGPEDPAALGWKMAFNKLEAILNSGQISD